MMGSASRGRGIARRPDILTAEAARGERPYRRRHRSARPLRRCSSIGFRGMLAIAKRKRRQILGGCVPGESEEIPEGAARRVRSRSRILVIVVGLACLLVAGAWIAYGRQTKTQQQAKATGGGTGAPPTRPVPVVVAPVRTGDLSGYLTALGSDTPLSIVTVKCRVDGR